MVTLGTGIGGGLVVDGEVQVGAHGFAGVRFFMAGILLYGFMRWRGYARPSSVEWRNLALIGLMMFVLTYGPLFWAEQYVASSMTAVIEAGLVWIGPRPASIRAMGRKDAAKNLMAKAGVPVTPGYLGEDQSEVRLQAEHDSFKQEGGIRPDGLLQFGPLSVATPVPAVGARVTLPLRATAR